MCGAPPRPQMVQFDYTAFLVMQHWRLSLCDLKSHVYVCVSSSASILVGRRGIKTGQKTVWDCPDVGSRVEQGAGIGVPTTEL